MWNRQIRRPSEEKPLVALIPLYTDSLSCPRQRRPCRCRMLAPSLQCKMSAPPLQCRMSAPSLQCRMPAPPLQCRMSAPSLQCRMPAPSLQVQDVSAVLAVFLGGAVPAVPCRSALPLEQNDSAVYVVSCGCCIPGVHARVHSTGTAFHCAKSLQGKAPCGSAVHGKVDEISPAPP